jgi:catechol 2,3-dioxygenase-like lactoylglutathione lyase family enzyme
MTIRLEHANLQVRDIDETVRFLQTAFPEFRIRGEGLTVQGWRWVHLGNDETYVNLSHAPEAPVEPRAPYSAKPGLNHLGFEVDDAEGVRRRLAEAGYVDSTFPNAHPHRTRVYFLDRVGQDWEFVQYHSEDPEKRNDYDDEAG